MALLLLEQSLAAGLLVNNSSVRRLEVWDNPITVEGALIILQSAVNSMESIK